MKVLFVGHYREGTGWGNAAIDYILAMDSAGIDVVCRPIKLNSRNVDLPERILELENKSSSGSDVCIQNVLPHHMDYNGRFKKNIALYFIETSSCAHSIWPNRINQLDEAWVCCNHNVAASKNSGIDIPLSVVPIPCDVSRYESSYGNLNVETTKNTFCFYFIGEVTRRKNLAALVKAFHLEFSPNEPVSLVIKANKFGETPESLFLHIQEICEQVKRNLKLYKDTKDYKKEVILTQHLTDEDMLKLHSSMDCFVMPSFGEAWCIPAFDAMGFGNTPICTNVGGMADFVQDGGILVDGNPEPVFGMVDTFQDICTGQEDWVNINIRLLQNSMRHIYTLKNTNKNVYEHKRNLCRKDSYNYSHENIGRLIKERLENAS